MNENKSNELLEKCEPLFDYINENYDPHTTVIVTCDGVKLVRDELYFPNKRND